MSGGVDSSLAAALLHEQGHEIVGVTLHLWDDDAGLSESLCCSLELTESARRVCAHLGVPYYVFNYQREFRRHVIEPFIHAYANGYTPNPCLECNRTIKFRMLLERARTLGFAYLATGHYARILGVGDQGSAFSLQPSAFSPQPSALSLQPSALSRQPSAFSPQPSALSPQPSAFSPQPSAFSLQPSAVSRQPSALSPQPSALSPQPSAFSLQPSAVSRQPSAYQLWRAVDRDKDQSYVLHMLGQQELAHLCFPVGMLTKPQVRELAAARGLASANQPESQEICVVPGGDYRELLREAAPTSLVPGPIVDGAGREIGQHQGLPRYTIGQRRGLGLGGGKPLFVVALDVARNALVVGPREALLCNQFVVDQVSFVATTWPSAPFTCEVQVRAHAAPVPAEVTPLADGRLDVRLHEPLRALTPGQAAVCYASDQLLGGGRIVRPSAG